MNRHGPLPYHIVLSQFPIPVPLVSVGHNLLALLDPAGHLLASLNGIAVKSDGRPTRFGIGLSPFDRLHVTTCCGHLYRSQQPQITLIAGSHADVLAHWRAAEAAADAINALELRYPPMGIIGWTGNSNSVATTLIAAMGLREPRIPGARWDPKRGKLVLAPHVLLHIRMKAPCSAQRPVRHEP
jgi:hypothetical protein